MTLKEQILLEAYGIDKINEINDKQSGLEEFVGCFMIDAKEYGLDEAIRMYGVLYGISEELNILKEDFTSFFNVLNEDGMPDFTGTLTAESPPLKTNLKVGATTGLSAGALSMRQFLNGQPNLLTKIKNFIGMTDKKKEDIKAHLAGQAAINKHNLSVSAPDAVSGAAAAPSVLSSLWNKIKNFFKGSFEPLKQMFTTGNFTGILNLPIIKGALAAGGIVAVIAILKKIFGNKKFNAEKQKIALQKIQAQIDANKK